MTDTIFKPGYDGARPSTNLTAPERQQLREGRTALIRRLHDAMLTLCVLGGTMDLGIVTGGTPSHIVEFGDRVGEEAADAPRAKFRPTATQIDYMDGDLRLLEGLQPEWFKVVQFRALNEFAKENGERGDWPWAKIGARFGKSASWAETAYDNAIVQAARRSGLLPMVTKDFAVVVVACWADQAWLSNLSTAADARQAVANHRSKSPLRIEKGVAIWTDGAPMAKRLVSEVKPDIRNLWSHGAWYKANPDRVTELVIESARRVGAGWMIEDIQTWGAQAA